MDSNGRPIVGRPMGFVQPNKRLRVDEGVLTGQLASPVLFTQEAPKPRLWTEVVKKRPVRADGPLSAATAATSGSSSSTAAAAASAPASSPSSAAAASAEPDVVLPRPATLTHLDEYLAVVGNMYYQQRETGIADSNFTLLRRTTLGVLTSPVREVQVWEKWSPLEIARFESAMCLVGKNFPVLAKAIGTSKTANDVIEFYYLWKQSKNYAAWKASYTHVYAPQDIRTL